MYGNNDERMYGFIHQAIAESNQGYVNSNISITLKLKCLIASDIQDSISSKKMLEDLFDAASKIAFITRDN